MASLIAAISGDDTGSTQILIAHVNDTRNLLNGTTAYLVLWIHNDANAFQINPATSGYVATNAWFQLLDNADAEVLAIRYNGQIRSSLATGTAPFVVASTTVVANLNADQVDGIDAPSSPTGALVTTTNTQTLTNKTLTAPTIADFTNAGHDHGDTDDGGVVIAAALGLTTQGDTLYRDATGNQRLAIGTAGQVNTVNAAATAPEYTTVPPSGAIVAYGAATAPTGWLLCNGAAVSRTTYAALFNIISTSFGTGDGSTTFNVPDLRGRFPAGVDGAVGRITANNTLGATSGAETHDHPSTASGNPSATEAVAAGSTQVGASPHTHTLDLAAINQLPPYQCVHYIIKT